MQNPFSTGQFAAQKQTFTERPICQGCNQAFVQQASHRMVLNEIRQSIDSERPSTEQRGGAGGVSELVSSGTGSYTQNVLCDDCMSKQLQSSDAGSLHSLKFSQLLQRDATTGLSQRESGAPRLGQFSSYQRFTSNE